MPGEGLLNGASRLGSTLFRLIDFFFVTNIVAMFLTFPRVVSGMAGNLKDSG